MNNRFWFYLSAFIIIAGLISYLIGINSASAKEISRINNLHNESLSKQLDTYLNTQTDARKLVSLSKRLGENVSLEIHEKIILAAYKLEPNDRDITVLASYFDETLEPKISELDPLYKK